MILLEKGERKYGCTSYEVLSHRYYDVSRYA